MQCEQFEQTLEQQHDGPLPPPALAHLETCGNCRGLTADFTAIHDLARELGAEGIAPPERVWISLRNQLEAERIIRGPQTESPRPRLGWWTVFQHPAVAGTFLSLLVIGAAAVSYQGGSPQSVAHQPSTVPSAESVFKEEVRTVGSDEFPGLQRQDAAVTDSIRRNLQVVDNFIEICEKSVSEQPDNEIAREYLYGAYQQKAELLAAAMNRNMTEGLQ